VVCLTTNRAVPLISRQHGQAAVLAFLLMGAVVLAGLMLFASGQRASAHMTLQNAADAGAYSVSQIEARDLNFAAYMNRAIIANEVALGQVVSLISWARYLQSIGSGLREIGAIIGPVTEGVGTIVLDSLAAFYDGVGAVAENSVNYLYQSVLGPLLKTIIEGYSTAEKAFHYITAYLVLVAAKKVIKGNDPNASLSAFGYGALLAHEYSYLKKFAPWQKTDKVSTGTGRMGAMVEASRDPFLTQRGKTWGVSQSVGFSLGSILNIIHAPHWLRDLISKFGFDFSENLSFTLYAGTQGGGEMRYISQTRGDRFNWSGADAAGMGFYGHFRLYLKVAGLTILDINTHLPPSFLGLGNEISLPFAGGSAQIGKAANSLNPSNMIRGDTVPDSSYGGAPGTYPQSWDAYIMPTISAKNFDSKYKGLPGFVDVPPYDETQGFEAPYVLVGVTADSPQPFIASGRFASPKGDAGNVIGALSKAEVYFARPNDLSYFARPDHLGEQGNPYDPYWQARLVDTTFADRALALAGQQQQYWMPSTKKIVNRLKQAKSELCPIIQQAGLPC
jgi:hypothetical protein